MISVTLTAEQANSVMNLLDAAIRAHGVNAAVTALPIMQDIQKQLAAFEKTAED